MFTDDRYLTCGIQTRIPSALQMLIWNFIDTMPEPKDYLQVFRLSVEDGKQRIEHMQEEPEFEKTYVFPMEEPIYEKIFVIDDGEHSTMLLAEEY